MSLLADRVITNPEVQKCPLVLLLDTSSSMAGAKCDQMHDGMYLLRDQIQGTDGVGGDEEAAKRIEVGVVGFGDSASVLRDFTPVADFNPPELTAAGSTAMAAGIREAVRLVERRKDEFRRNGVDYTRPWIVMITDGAPTDMTPGSRARDEIVQLIADGQTQNKFVFFPIGVDDADMDCLNQLAQRGLPAVLMRGHSFAGMFQWLSNSMENASRSRPGDMLQLEDPTSGPSAWAVRT